MTRPSLQRFKQFTPLSDGEAVTEKRIAGCERQVAQPSGMPDAPDRRTLGAREELDLAPVQQLRNLRILKAVSGLPVGHSRNLRIFVPGTDQLAVVTAVDAVADGRTPFNRDRAVQLNGEVADAAPRVQAVGLDDGACRAGGQAGGAAAAMR